MTKIAKLLTFVGIPLIILASLGYQYYVPGISPALLNRKYRISAENYVSVNGMKVHYREEGLQEDNIPIVLLHGTGSSLYTWNGWTKALKSNQKIVRLDLPGFGLTGPHPAADYSIGVYLDFLSSFLNKLEIKRCILVGNSLGGEIAWRFALKYPQKVEQLILIDASGFPVGVKKVPVPYIILRVPVVRELLNKFTPPEVFQTSLEFLYSKDEKVTDSLVQVYFDMNCRAGNREALTERMESLPETDQVDNLHEIRVPTLILWGKDDQLIPPSHGRKFNKAIPNSALYIFDSCGHMPMEEIPDESVLVAKAFIRENS